MRRTPGACLAAALLLAAPAAAADLVAERIDERNAARRVMSGPDAIGGVGDWFLANDRVQVIVDAATRRHAKLNHGGTIVDAGVRGRRGDDQFARLFPLVNLSQRVVVGADAIRAEVDSDGAYARLVVTSAGMRSVVRGGVLDRLLDPLVPETEAIAAVASETRYEVRPGEPFVRISTRLTNRGDEPAPVFAWGDLWMRGGRSMRSFVGNTLTLEASRGFEHLSFDRSAVLASGDAMAGFTFAAMAGLPQWPKIAYALVAPERAATNRLLFGVTGKHVTLANVFRADDGWDGFGLARLARALFADLEPGESWTHERRLVVVPGAGVSAATDVVFPLLGVADVGSGVAGRVEPADARVVLLVRTPTGAPVTQIAVTREGPEAGRYRAVLPPGDYRVELRAAHRVPRTLELAVSPGRVTELPTQQLGPVGVLAFAPAFADGGPGRLVVSGAGGTPDPVFRPELLGFTLDGRPVASGIETGEIHFGGLPSDPREVAIAPGRYRLTATRGPEYDVATQQVEVAAGGTVRVAPFDLRRAIDAPGMLSADFHVHAQASDDSGMDNASRLLSFLAESVDVMVSTDHDHVGSFDAAAAELGFGDRMIVVEGVEVTSSAASAAAPWTLGHHNAWPVRHRPHAHRRGAPPSQELVLADLYALLRAEYGASVVQLNHALGGSPDEDGEENFLAHLGSVGEPFDPRAPLEAEANRTLLAPGADGRTRALDFDAMEVMNGSSFRQYRRLREAWYALLRRGVRRTATGNSDTHGPSHLAAYPRNYVAHEGAYAAASFDRAVREGRLYTTTGPLITRFRANDAGMGDTVEAQGGRVRVEVTVAAAPWVPVEEVRLLVNGEVVQRVRGLADASSVVRLERDFDLALRGDAFLTLEAGAALDADPVAWPSGQAGAYAVVARGFVSQALANPIWIDADGDGRVLVAAPAPRGSTQLPWIGGLVVLLALVWLRLRARARSARPGPPAIG